MITKYIDIIKNRVSRFIISISDAVNLRNLYNVNYLFFLLIFFVVKGCLGHINSVKAVIFNNSSDLSGSSTNFEFYSYPKVKPFGPIDLFRSVEFSKDKFESVILNSVPSNLRKRMKKYISLTLKYSQIYQIDPFWALSIMWTESHFNPKAVSNVSALGLMQIMPKTGHYLSIRMKRTLDFHIVKKLIRNPSVNIEMGIYYLKILQQSFKNNHVIATVAYNLGPGNVINRLKRGLGVGKRNLYLNKVRYAYKKLVKDYKRLVKMTESPYKSTLVVARKRISTGVKVRKLLSLKII